MEGSGNGLTVPSADEDLAEDVTGPRAWLRSPRRGRWGAEEAGCAGHWRGRNGGDGGVLAGGWLEGEAPGAGLRPQASHRTFNVLVGAQPVPSIECSRSKLKHRQAGGQQGAAPGVRGTGVRAPPPGALGRRPVVGRGPHSAHGPAPEAGLEPSPSSRVTSPRGARGPSTPMDAEVRGGAEARSARSTDEHVSAPWLELRGQPGQQGPPTREGSHFCVGSTRPQRPGREWPPSPTRPVGPTQRLDDADPWWGWGGGVLRDAAPASAVRGLGS